MGDAPANLFPVRMRDRSHSMRANPATITAICGQRPAIPAFLQLSARLVSIPLMIFLLR